MGSDLICTITYGGAEDVDRAIDINFQSHAASPADKRLSKAGRPNRYCDNSSFYF